MHPAHLPPTATAFLKHLREHGPTPAREMAAIFKKSLEQATMHLRIARNLGYAQVMKHGGHGPLWFAIEHSSLAAELEEAAQQAAKERRKLRNRQYAKDSRARTAIAKSKDYHPIVRVIVPADKAPPQVVRGPISVFHLGAML